MSKLICWYFNNKNYIELIKDSIYFIGIIPTVCYIMKFITNYNFNKKSKEIAFNLQKRKELEFELKKYVDEKYNYGKKDIGISFIYYKNYPWNLENDGCRYYLFNYELHDDLFTGYISNTGINVVEYPRLHNESIYINKKNNFYFEYRENKIFRNFEEIKGKYLIVYELPYSNIVNFDFKEKLEYEPIIYVKEKYTKLSYYNPKIFSNSIRLIFLKGNDDRFNFDLKQDHFIKKPYSFKYFYLNSVLILKSFLLKIKNKIINIWKTIF